MNKKEFYSTTELAKMLHVSVGSVINWIDDGLIRANITPGGHRKISFKELNDFLVKYNYNIGTETISKKNVYVVNCEEKEKQILKEYFENHKQYDVKCFSNIFSALIAVGKKNPEVIIIDSHQLEEMMPDITNNINNEKDIDKIHMFVLTKNIKHKESYQNSGVCAVIGKPFTINDFNNLINSI